MKISKFLLYSVLCLTVLWVSESFAKKANCDEEMVVGPADYIRLFRQNNYLTNHPRRLTAASQSAKPWVPERGTDEKIEAFKAAVKSQLVKNQWPAIQHVLQEMRERAGTDPIGLDPVETYIGLYRDGSEDAKTEFHRLLADHPLELKMRWDEILQRLTPDMDKPQSPERLYVRTFAEAMNLHRLDEGVRQEIIYSAEPVNPYFLVMGKFVANEADHGLQTQFAKALSNPDLNWSQVVEDLKHLPAQ